MSFPSRPGAAQAGNPVPRWYQGISRAQWLLLVVACIAWIFDSYASQIFNVTRGVMLGDIFHLKTGDPGITFWGESFLSISLAGGAVGGIFFGSLADRLGRRPAMILTILTFTVSCGLIGLAQSAWQVAVCRFFVCVGASGGWSVGAALVSEMFPPRSRAQAGGIFHSTSAGGIWLAVLVGMAIDPRWRLGYLIGFVPIVLIFFVRTGVTESQAWTEEAGQAGSPKRGSLRELLLVRPWWPRAILGMLLASVGVGTYWCITVGGQDLVQDFLMRRGVDAATALAKAQFDYGFLISGGSFVGSLLFGPFTQWLGRRKAFALAILSGIAIVPATWYLPRSYGELMLMLPLYGILTAGFHSGFAIYFPELFPTHLRGTGAGFCFNAGRLIAAVMLVFSGWLKSRHGLELREATCLLTLLYVPALVCLWYLPETKGKKLAEIT